MAQELARLIRAGVRIGIATGRGKSVRTELRGVLSRDLWDHVIVGYYNGGDIGALGDDAHPNGVERTSDVLAPIAAALRHHDVLQRYATFELRLPQVKVEITSGPSHDWACEMVEHVVRAAHICGVSVLHSAHSMDILAPGVTKESVVRAVAASTREGAITLRIGDRGRYPGNDHALLAGPHALSVDQVSPDPQSCWNLAPPGFRHVAASRYYLAHLQESRRGLRLRIP